MTLKSASRRFPIQAISVSWPMAGVAVVTIDNPPSNQLDSRARRALHDGLANLSVDEGLRVMILRGAQGRFSTGNDITELSEAPPASRVLMTIEWDDIYRRLRDLPVPSIAAVRGNAVGGGFELMMSCDVRVLATDANVACTAARLGLVSSTFSLARQLAPAVASELFYTGRTVGAEEALRLGIATRIVEPDEVDDEVLAVAERIASQPPEAIRRGNQLLKEAQNLDRLSHDSLQREALVELMDTAEHHAAVEAFLSTRRGTSTAPGRGRSLSP